ncbi:MAG: tRNA (adenosine(37)-N6)-threonylcarbamoyltransferase complex dimerization subunit type 1 TsaB [Gemmatimonadetes bacterium]|nr:MAG: tRNA (adenosine(37)-N6)-threonylcarbamoyltransferase complex dimerization subunit type 1 TsaB [Gemmatimonadota bacterium]
MSTRWLAIDTATDLASVAIGSAEHIEAVGVIRGARQHAAQILPVIQQVLAATRTRLAQIGGIVIGDGPGSFTGLRIGWAAAKGLAHERDLPIVAVPSLLGAANAAAVGSTGPIAACFDALRGQVYGAIYAFYPGRVETLVAPDLFTIATLAAATTMTPALAVGDGAERYREEIATWIGRPPLALETSPPVAGSLLALAPIVGYPATGEPVYGRPAEAQVKWETSHGRPLPHSSR